MKVVSLTKYRAEKLDKGMTQQLEQIEEDIDYILCFSNLLKGEKEKEAVEWITDLALLAEEVKQDKQKVQNILNELGEFK